MAASDDVALDETLDVGLAEGLDVVDGLADAEDDEVTRGVGEADEVEVLLELVELELVGCTRCQYWHHKTQGERLQ